MTPLSLTLYAVVALVGLRLLVTRHGRLTPALAAAPRRLTAEVAGLRLLAGDTVLRMSATGTGGRGGAPQRSTDRGPTRRDFLRTTWLLGSVGFLTAFAGSTVAFLWPNVAGAFGAVLDVDTEEAVLAYIRENREPFPYPAGRMYLVEYDAALDPDGQYAEITNGASVMALYQKCVHLGCKVPWCATAQWYQCPCHGSNYNRWGEYQIGPAPRGLDRFSLTVQDGRVMVDTSLVITGPTRTGGVLQQPQEGPSCVSV